MKNIASAIWLVGWPICVTLDRYVSFLICESIEVDSELSFVTIAIWICVAIWLKDKDEQK